MAKVNAADLIGLNEEEVVNNLRRLGFYTRIVARDGKDFVHTAEANSHRFNLEITKNKVTGAFQG